MPQTVKLLWEERFEQLEVVVRKYGIEHIEEAVPPGVHMGDGMGQAGAGEALAAAKDPGGHAARAVQEIISFDSDDSDVVIVSEVPAPSTAASTAPRSRGRDDVNPPGAKGGAGGSAAQPHATAGGRSQQTDSGSFPLTHTLALLRAMSASTKRHGGAAPGAKAPPALFRVRAPVRMARGACCAAVAGLTSVCRTCSTTGHSRWLKRCRRKRGTHRTARARRVVTGEACCRPWIH